MELLVGLGSVTREGEIYLFDLANVKTDWDFDAHQVKQFHYNNLRLAMATIPWPIDQRFFSNITIPCTNEMLASIKSEIRDLCLRLLAQSNAQVNTAAECQRVMSLEFALFPYFVFQ